MMTDNPLELSPFGQTLFAAAYTNCLLFSVTFGRADDKKAHDVAWKFAANLVNHFVDNYENKGNKDESTKGS